MELVYIYFLLVWNCQRAISIANELGHKPKAKACGLNFQTSRLTKLGLDSLLNFNPTDSLFSYRYPVVRVQQHDRRGLNLNNGNEHMGWTKPILCEYNLKLNTPNKYPRYESVAIGHR